MERKEKVLSIEESVKMIKSGDIVAIGGNAMHNHPMALVREIIRQEKKDLTLIGGTASSIDIDLPIGAGCVKKTMASYIGFEWLGLAPNFRKYVKDGLVEVWECDESHIISGLYAASHDLPFMHTKGGIGTDLPRLNPDLKIFRDPINGEELIAVPPIKPDVAIILGQYGDVYGNIVHLGSVFLDLLIASATKRVEGKVIALVDRIIPHRNILSSPRSTTIPSFLVDAVVEAPFGAHPCSSHGLYSYDEPHLKEYIKACSDERTFKEYLDRYVYKTHTEYMETIGMERLRDLNFR
ncbi:MAG: CoA transferase subunit A [Candidatus Syntropharchaeia archaeon]